MHHVHIYLSAHAPSCLHTQMHTHQDAWTPRKEIQGANSSNMHTQMHRCTDAHTLRPTSFETHIHVDTNVHRCKCTEMPTHQNTRTLRCTEIHIIWSTNAHACITYLNVMYILPEAEFLVAVLRPVLRELEP